MEVACREGPFQEDSLIDLIQEFILALVPDERFLWDLARAHLSPSLQMPLQWYFMQSWVPFSEGKDLMFAWNFLKGISGLGFQSFEKFGFTAGTGEESESFCFLLPLSSLAEGGLEAFLFWEKVSITLAGIEVELKVWFLLIPSKILEKSRCLVLTSWRDWAERQLLRKFWRPKSISVRMLTINMGCCFINPSTSWEWERRKGSQRPRRV
jgi:hypothetical protein